MARGQKTRGVTRQGRRVLGIGDAAASKGLVDRAGSCQEKAIGRARLPGKDTQAERRNGGRGWKPQFMHPILPPEDAGALLVFFASKFQEIIIRFGLFRSLKHPG